MTGKLIGPLVIDVGGKGNYTGDESSAFEESPRHKEFEKRSEHSIQSFFPYVLEFNRDIPPYDIENKEVVEWILDNVKERYFVDLYNDTIYFETEEDAFAFKLRWLE